MRASGEISCESTTLEAQIDLICTIITREVKFTWTRKLIYLENNSLTAMKSPKTASPSTLLAASVKLWYFVL